MKQRLGIAAIVLFCLSSSIFAQNKTQKDAREDNSSFTLTESQLNENDDSYQSVSAYVSSNNDVYLSNVGYLFSPMRFRVRGYDSRYNNVYINGVQFNDVETGRFSYGMIGGLNDAVRNKEGISPFEFNHFTFGSIGGATNINVRASQYGAGSKFTLSACNRSYLLRSMYTYSTGLMKNGWAFTGSAGYRWANEGIIEGTFYNAFSYFFAAEKIINDRHSISFTTWGSPTERGQQGASTQEAYYLAGSNYYNPNWGYQNGEKRNARVVNSFEPSAVMQWIFNVDDKNILTTSASAKYSRYGKTALGWSGNAADPRPDYYKKLPSSVYNVYSGVQPTNDQREQFNRVTSRWINNKRARQIDWDELYFANAQSNAVGGETLYYVERRQNDQLAFNLSSVLNHKIDNDTHLIGGVNFNATKGMHYKTMSDLMGGERYTDVDKFSVRDYGYNSSIIQNDLDNPNRQIKEGDRFGYDYNVYVYKQNAWARYQGKADRMNYFVAGHIGATQMFRDGQMRNGRAPEKSLGKSSVSKFLEGAVKLGATYAINGNHSVEVNASLENRAPIAYNSFIAPRIKNDFARDLKTEKIFNGEATYRFSSPFITGRVTAYYTRFKDQVEMDAFYNDSESRFTYLSMSGIDKEYWGVEIGATMKLLSNLSLTAIGTYSDARYMNNPEAMRTYESQSESNLDQVYCKGLRDNGTPLSAYSLALDYSTNGWFFNVTGNYYDRVYLDFSTYRRLKSVLDSKQATAVPAQEKLQGGFMLDASIGKLIRLKNGRSLSINLNINNVLNNTNLRTGGYEQNRDDSYEDGSQRTYVFSKNSKYYYARPCNAFLNIGYRF